MKKRIVNITVRIVAVAVLISLCALPVAIAPRDARAAFGDCIAYDTFTRDDGAIGSTETTGPSSEACPQYAWTGGTWAVSGSKVVDTPTLGSELLANGDMETGDPPTNWTSYNATLDGVADERTGGSGAQSIDVVLTADYGYTWKSFTSVIGYWYSISDWAKRITTNPNLYLGSAAYTGGYSSSSTSWSQIFIVGRAGSTTSYATIQGATGIGKSYRADDVIVKQLTLSSLLASINLGSPNGTYSVAATISKGNQAGLALFLNSQSSPTAGIVIYHDGGNLKVDKFTDLGTWTNIISGTPAYSAGRVIKVDITTAAGHVYLNAYYNDVQIGTQQDITDAAIISNTYHGVFSTYSGNSLDNFYISNNIPNTATPTNTATNTATNTPTDTATNTPTASDTPTNTPTNTATFTNTFTITYTPTFTDTPTETYTPTDTNTPTASKTPTNTFTPTNTATLHYDATTTYEAAYAYYTGIAEENYPTIILLSILCGIILLGVIIWAAIYFMRRRR